MNNDIKKLNVKHHDSNGNVSWEEVLLTAFSGLALIGVFIYVGHYLHI